MSADDDASYSCTNGAGAKFQQQAPTQSSKPLLRTEKAVPCPPPAAHPVPLRQHRRADVRHTARPPFLIARSVLMLLLGPRQT